MNETYSDPIEDYKLRNESDISQQEGINTPALPTMETSNRIVSSKAFMREFKEEVWIVKPVIPSTELGEIFGASGSRKTFMALDVGTCVHNGLSWHGFEVTKGNVLYICGEGKNGVRKRLSAFTNHYNVDEAMHILPVSIDMMKEDSLQTLAQDIDNIGAEYSLIIIDTLNANFSGAEDSADDFAVMKKNLQKYICNDTRMVTWVHHTGNAEGKRSRGTSARYAGIDMSIQITKDEKFSTLTCRKMKDAEEFEPISFSFDSVATDFCEEDGEIVFSIVPKIAEGRVVKKAIKFAKYNDEICKGIRLALKDNKGVLPSEEFEKMFNLRTGENRVLHIDVVREYAYKMFADERKSQAFTRWVKSSTKSAHLCFYDDFMILSNDAKLHTGKK